MTLEDGWRIDATDLGIDEYIYFEHPCGLRLRLRRERWKGLGPPRLQRRGPRRGRKSSAGQIARFIMARLEAGAGADTIRELDAAIELEYDSEASVSRVLADIPSLEPIDWRTFVGYVADARSRGLRIDLFLDYAFVAFDL